MNEKERDHVERAKGHIANILNLREATPQTLFELAVAEAQEAWEALSTLLSAAPEAPKNPYNDPEFPGVEMGPTQAYKGVGVRTFPGHKSVDYFVNERVRNEALEEAAKVADRCDEEEAEHIADAIRALKSPSKEQGG